MLGREPYTRVMPTILQAYSWTWGYQRCKWNRSAWFHRVWVIHIFTVAARYFNIFEARRFLYVWKIKTACLGLVGTSILDYGKRKLIEGSFWRCRGGVDCSRIAYGRASRRFGLSFLSMFTSTLMKQFPHEVEIAMLSWWGIARILCLLNSSCCMALLCSYPL